MRKCTRPLGGRGLCAGSGTGKRGMSHVAVFKNIVLAPLSFDCAFSLFAQKRKHFLFEPQKVHALDRNTPNLAATLTQHVVTAPFSLRSSLAAASPCGRKRASRAVTSGLPPAPVRTVVLQKGRPNFVDLAADSRQGYEWCGGDGRPRGQGRYEGRRGTAPRSTRYNISGTPLWTSPVQHGACASTL